jgi:glycyl-tRNA synthetase beta chain
VLGPMLWQARAAVQQQLGSGAAGQDEKNQLWIFFAERLRHLMQVRGLDFEEIQAETGRVDAVDGTSPADLFERARELARVRTTPVFASVAEAYKRATNIVAQAWETGADERPRRHNVTLLVEPAEIALRNALDRVGDEIQAALRARQPSKALGAIASIEPELAKFFSEVRVMVEDKDLQDARLALLAELRDRIAEYGDISAIVTKQA